MLSGRLKRKRPYRTVHCRPEVARTGALADSRGLVPQWFVCRTLVYQDMEMGTRSSTV